MKLSAVAQRGARKDFFDLVALGRAGLDLARQLDCFRQRFGVRDVGHVLAALTYFEDAEGDPEPIRGAHEDWSRVKATLVAWVREFAG